MISPYTTNLHSTFHRHNARYRIEESGKLIQANISFHKTNQQPFDLVFHPTESVLYTSLLTGEVKAFRYDDETGETSESSGSWTARPSKRAARTLSMEENGNALWMGGKGGGLLYVALITCRATLILTMQSYKPLYWSHHEGVQSSS